MRFLPVLLIALALLPLLDASRCYDGEEVKVNGKTVTNKKVKLICPSGVCMFLEQRSGKDQETPIHIVEYACMPDATVVDCEGGPVMKKGIVMASTTCVCKGDLCNESMATTLAAKLQAPPSCYKGTERKLDGDIIMREKNKVNCDSGICEMMEARLTIDGALMEIATRKCLPEGSECKAECVSGSMENKGHNMPTTTCCCEGDLCNDSMATTLAAETQPLPFCYKGTERKLNGNILNSEKNKVNCDSGICEMMEARLTIDGALMEIVTRKCLPERSECKPECVSGSMKSKGHNMPTTTCCCKGDLCNDSMATTLAAKPITPVHDSTTQSQTTLIIIACSVGGIILAAVVIGAIICRCKRRRPVEGSSGMNIKNSKDGRTNNTKRAGYNETNSDVESAPSDL